jgi:hypothetical protein
MTCLRKKYLHLLNTLLFGKTKKPGKLINLFYAYVKVILPLGIEYDLA